MQNPANHGMSLAKSKSPDWAAHNGCAVTGQLLQPEPHATFPLVLNTKQEGIIELATPDGERMLVGGFKDEFGPAFHRKSRFFWRMQVDYGGEPIRYTSPIIKGLRKPECRGAVPGRFPGLALVGSTLLRRNPPGAPARQGPSGALAVGRLRGPLLESPGAKWAACLFLEAAGPGVWLQFPLGFFAC